MSAALQAAPPRLTGLRLPPANQQAEHALLGAILANNRAYEQVQDFLRPAMFADPINGRIYEAMAARIDAGQLADVITLRQQFEHSGTLAEVGGAAYLSQLLVAMVGIINAGEYGRVIRDAWLRRGLAEIGESVVLEAFGDIEAGTGADILDAAEGRLYALAESAADGGAGDDVVSAGEAAGRAIEAHFAARESAHGIVGVTSGYPAVDRMLGGFRRRQFILLAGRPAMGKTAIGTGMAVRAASEGHRVLFLTAEMAAEEISARVQAAIAGLPLLAVLRGRILDPGTNRLRELTEEETGRLMQSRATMGALPLTWVQRASPTVAYLRGLARRLKRRQGLDAVFVDYLGLMRSSAEAARQNRNAEISEISAGLKALAGELDVPVIALSQLSRDVEKRDDRRPVLSDLRDSGSLEQDANVVMFLYREHYYLKNATPQRREKEKAEDFERRQEAWAARCAATLGWGELVVAKQRQGPTGSVRVRFDDRTTWFRDEGEEWDGPALPGVGAL